MIEKIRCADILPEGILFPDVLRFLDVIVIDPRIRQMDPADPLPVLIVHRDEPVRVILIRIPDFDLRRIMCRFIIQIRHDLSHLFAVFLIGILFDFHTPSVLIVLILVQQPFLRTGLRKILRAPAPYQHASRRDLRRDRRRGLPLDGSALVAEDRDDQHHSRCDRNDHQPCNDPFRPLLIHLTSPLVL